MDSVKQKVTLLQFLHVDLKASQGTLPLIPLKWVLMYTVLNNLVF